jgi:hypothetical protein
VIGSQDWAIRSDQQHRRPVGQQLEGAEHALAKIVASLDVGGKTMFLRR